MEKRGPSRSAYPDKARKGNVPGFLSKADETANKANLTDKMRTTKSG
jgi:hypothetical protein